MRFRTKVLRSFLSSWQVFENAFSSCLQPAAILLVAYWVLHSFSQLMYIGLHILMHAALSAASAACPLLVGWTSCASAWAST